MIFALFGAAWATTPVVAVAAGFDLPTEEPWVGLELAFQADNTKGLAAIGRVDAAFGFGEGRPLVISDVGLAYVLPEDEATVRLGAIFRPVFLYTETRLPFQLGDPSEGPALGVVPSVQGLIEFEWNTGVAPVAVGFRGGVGSVATDSTCDIDDPDPSRCVSWYPGAVGGFLARKRFANGLSLEGIVGTTTSVSVGWAL